MTALAPFRHAVAALLIALLPIVVSGAGVSAQTIENTADATWSFQGQSGATTSNTVVVEVEQIPVEIETFAPNTDGQQSFTFTSSRCFAAGGAIAQSNQTPPL